MTVLLTNPARRTYPTVFQKPSRTFGDYEVVRRIGRGGMAEVFLATRTAGGMSPGRAPVSARSIELPRIGALKRLRPDAVIPAVKERFQHECALATRLEHPNLVRSYEAGEVDGEPYLYSELVLGQNLSVVSDRAWEREVRVGARVAIHVMLEILAALSVLHRLRGKSGRALNVVHRDITPSNVLLGYDGRVRLTDLGIAKSALNEHQLLTLNGQVLGTAHYLPPELARGEAATPASDLYGAAAVLFRLLTGAAPYQGTTREVLFQLLSDERPPSLSRVRSDLPGWFCAIVDQMLDRDPGARPSSAHDLLREVTARASARRMLLERSDMSDWMEAIFAEEKVSDEGEAVALAEGKRERGHSETLGPAKARWTQHQPSPPRRRTPDEDTTLDEQDEWIWSGAALPGFVS